MSHSYKRVFLHIVFGVKYGAHRIDRETGPLLFAYMAGICRNLGCKVVVVGGYRNHVHILCSLNENLSIMKLLKEVKCESSEWMQKKGQSYFYWQRGYWVESVSPRSFQSAANYIKNQELIHLRRSFKVEYRGYFERYGGVVDCDEIFE